MLSRVNWQSPTWMSRYLVFDAAVDGIERSFAVIADLLTVAPDEPAALTLERNLFRLRSRIERAARENTASHMIYII